MEKTLFLPTRDLIVFPGIVTPLYVGRLRSIKTLEEAVSTKSKMILCMQKNASVQEPDVEKDLYDIGVLVNILQIIKMPNDNIKVLVEAETRVEVKNLRVEDDIYRTEYVILDSFNGETREVEAIYRNALSLFEKYIQLTGNISSEVLIKLKGIDNISNALDIMASNLDIKSEMKQELLETLDVNEKGMKILNLLTSEIEMEKLETKIEKKIKSKMNEAQKNYYLREKINIIKDEIGDMSQDDDTAELIERVKKAKLPKKVQEKVEAEIKKLSKMPPFSAESAVSRNYIETILDLPWSKQTKDIVDLKKANTILERDHYGLQDAKEKVLDYLAVKKLNPNMKGSILCFAGPPGIGKTSLVKSIADAMGRKDRKSVV